MNELLNIANRGADVLIDKYVPGQFKDAVKGFKDMGKQLIGSSLNPTPAGDVAASVPSSTSFNEPEP